LESLKRLEELLPDDQFMRVHKSFIVAFNLISSIDGNQVELNGKKIPIGKSYKEEVLRRFKIG
jgi:DNA-binding LytR/AlgR family response regulator